MYNKNRSFFFLKMPIMIPAAVHVVSSLFFDSDANAATKVEGELCVNQDNRFGCSQIGGTSVTLQSETLYYIIVTTKAQGNILCLGQAEREPTSITKHFAYLYGCFTL